VITSEASNTSGDVIDLDYEKQQRRGNHSGTEDSTTKIKFED